MGVPLGSPPAAAVSFVPSRAHVFPVALVAALVLALAGCGDSSSGDNAGRSSHSTAPAPTATLPGARSPGHAAPELEALLPSEIDGLALRKGSTTGAHVFGRNAFSREMTRFLASVGKQPRDLRFANAQDPSRRLRLEVGVFQVSGVDAPALRRAIVTSSRPSAPGLTASPATVAGKPVTKLVYSSGAALYLYARGERVFYVGTQREDLASEALARLP